MHNAQQKTYQFKNNAGVGPDQVISSTNKERLENREKSPQLSMNIFGT